MKEQERSIISMTESGLYCEAGRFWIDPSRRVARAVITHAHTDHARPGMERYLTHRDGVPLLRSRLGDGISVEGIEYGRSIRMHDATVTLFPAGHILGSSQVHIDVGGRQAVVTGDYKRALDPTCTPFEVARCDELISEATFALPVFRWTDPAQVMSKIASWWGDNVARGLTSVLFVYALGKAQRVLASLPSCPGPVLAHGAITKYQDAYASAGFSLPSLIPCEADAIKAHRGQALVLAPPSAQATPWHRKLGPTSTGFASGWMRIRGRKRHRGVDEGFVLSDHADWGELQETIKESGAERVRMMHGYTDVISRWLSEQGLDAAPLVGSEAVSRDDDPALSEPSSSETLTLWDLPQSDRPGGGGA
ncbi:MAG: ligase-associated DNA damage response exonuclease [Phycisphaerae bacterium]